jgi:heme/copper-type cytochrome/quinol oxidase subunit 2
MWFDINTIVLSVSLILSVLGFFAIMVDKMRARVVNLNSNAEVKHA